MYFDVKSYMNRSMKQCQVYVSLILHVTMFICLTGIFVICVKFKTCILSAVLVKE